MPPEGYVAADEERRSGEEGRPGRTPFELDYDRLVHKPVFRALQGKTQVVTPGQADFFRTRLTHTLEVAQLARRLARRLGSSPDVVEAAAILHDLGHPPFGHIGEDELCGQVDTAAETQGLFERDAARVIVRDDAGGFEGNAQSIRLAMHAAWRPESVDGLDLTRAVLDGATKYPWVRSATDTDKFCFYPEAVPEGERTCIEWVREGVPEERERTKSFEAQIVDWADEVVYAIHDLEDWYKAGFIPLALIRGSIEERERCAYEIKELWRLPRVDPHAAGTAQLAREVAGRRLTGDDVNRALATLFGSGEGAGALGLIDGDFDGSRAALKRVHGMRRLLFGTFVDKIEDWVAEPAAPRVRHQNDLDIPFETKLLNEVIRAMLRVYVTGSRRLVSQQLGQRHIVRELWAAHWTPVARWLDDHRTSRLALFPLHMQEAIEDARADAQPTASLLRLVADHLSGMSDRAASDLHARLSGSQQGAVNAFLLM